MSFNKKLPGIQRNKKLLSVMKSPPIDTDTEMTQIIELVEKDIKTVITIFFHIKKVKKKLSILSGDVKDQD